MVMWCRTDRLTILCLLETALRCRRNSSLLFRRRFLALSSLIREREGSAPAIFADLTGDHLAVFRWLEQRAHRAAINVLWRVLIFSLLPRHFFRCFRLRNPQKKTCRGPPNNRAHYLSPRPVYSLFDHGASSRAIARLSTGHCNRSNCGSERAETDLGTAT